MTAKPRFIYRDKVRYSDCDMHQHMNHAAYFSFFEQARVEYIAKLGLKPTSDFRSIPFILAGAHCDYKAPAHLNDAIEIHLGTTHIGTKSFRIDYEMYRAKTDELLATGYTVLVMFNYEKMQSIPIPEGLKKKLATFS